MDDRSIPSDSNNLHDPFDTLGPIWGEGVRGNLQRPIK